MLPDTSAFTAFIMASLVLYVVPGPAMMYIASRSLGQGRRAGMLSALGTSAGLLVHTFAAALGLSALLLWSPVVFQVVRWLGVAYLLYLGVRLLMSGNLNGLEAVAEDVSGRRIVLQGMLINLLNPKIALFFLAFLPQFVDAGPQGAWVQMVVLGCLFTSGAVIWTQFLALVFGGAGNWMGRHTGIWKWQRRFTGATLVGLAAHLAFSDMR